MLRQIGAEFGFVEFVIGASVVIYALALLVSGSDIEPSGGGMSILVPSYRAIRMLGGSGYVPVFRDGWWWTVLTAGWLHLGFLHILFNMMWVRDLGRSMVDLVGTPRTIIIYVVSGVCGFALSSSLPWLPLHIPFLGGAGLTAGASASIFGLLGALVHYGRKSGSSYIHSQAVNYAIILFVMGLIMPGVDNTAHAGGFIGGYGMSMAFNPLTRERGDHMIAALGCLAATFAALLYTVASALHFV
jgi:rhomboid protease GluP